MRTTIPVMFTFLISLPQAFANLADVNKYCFDKNRVQITKTDTLPEELKSLYEKSFTEKVIVGSIEDVIRGPQNSAAEVGNFFRRLIGAEESQGAQIKKFLVENIKWMSKEKNSTRLEQLCTIKCVVSNLMQYKRDNNAKFSGVDDLYQLQQGICTEFSAISADLLSAFKYTHRRAYTPHAHTYNEVKFDNTWYIFDSTSSDCNFFQQED